MQNKDQETRANRRNLLQKGIFALAGGILGSLLAKKASAAEETASPNIASDGDVMRRHMIMNDRPPVEPLDTMLLFERSDNSTQGGTKEILSLEHEERGNKSWPWTIYSHLTSHHTEGDACVLCSRLHKKGAGWSCGLHSEVFSTAPMVGLGVNVEMSNDYPGPEKTQIIGMNIQSHGKYPCQYGIQVHDADGHWEKGIGLNGSGKVGMELGGKYDTGINMQSNTIRLNEGTCIELDGEGKIKMRYKDGKIEFLNGSRRVAFIDMNALEHEV